MSTLTLNLFSNHNKDGIYRASVFDHRRNEIADKTKQSSYSSDLFMAPSAALAELGYDRTHALYRTANRFGQAVRASLQNDETVLGYSIIATNHPTVIAFISEPSLVGFRAMVCVRGVNDKLYSTHNMIAHKLTETKHRGFQYIFNFFGGVRSVAGTIVEVAPESLREARFGESVVGAPVAEQAPVEVVETVPAPVVVAPVVQEEPVDSIDEPEDETTPAPVHLYDDEPEDETVSDQVIELKIPAAEPEYAPNAAIAEMLAGMKKPKTDYSYYESQEYANHRAEIAARDLRIADQYAA